MVLIIQLKEEGKQPVIKEIAFGIIMFIESDGVVLTDYTLTTDETPTTTQELATKISFLSDMDSMDLEQ